MTDADQSQKSLDGYKSEVQEKTNFDNVNKGKPLLNSDDEYIFRLTKFPHVISVLQFKDLKDGTKTQVKVDKAVCEFSEQNSGNVVTAFFRIDKLNFSDEEAYRSAIIKFFHKIGQPLSEYKSPNWTEKFVVGMRFRARVVVKSGMDKDGFASVKYYLDVPTVRKLLATDFPNTSQPAPESPQQPANAPTMQDQYDYNQIMLILKGSGINEVSAAMMRLMESKAAPAIIQAFLQMDKEGKIKYPL